MEKLYIAFLFENEIDCKSSFDQFVIENFQVVCPSGGVISYEDAKVMCSVLKGDVEDEEKPPGDEVPWL